MRHATLVELAARDGIVLPDALVEDWPPQLSAADEKGWFRFQRLYDVARSVLRTEDDVRRLVREAAEDDVADGGRWLEIQVDPSGYAARFGGITAFTDLVLDAVAGRLRAAPGSGIAVVIAANRTRHPLDARTLARLAAQYAGRGRGRLRALQRRAARHHRRLRAGLRDRRAGRAAARPRTAASCSARTACGPASTTCTPDRLGHGVRVAEDPRAARPGRGPGRRRSRCARSPTSRSASTATSRRCRCRTLLEAGATVALGADDPLLFGSRLASQYATMRAAHDLSDDDARRARPDVACAPRGHRSTSRSADARRHRRLALVGRPDPLGWAA